MKCKECEFLKVDKPDRYNEGYAYCSKYDVSMMLVYPSYKRKLENLECYADERSKNENKDN